MRPWRPLSTYADLLGASDGDAFVRWDLEPATTVTGWALDRGVAFVSPSGRRSLIVVSDPQVAARTLRTHLDLAADAATGADQPRSVTVPLGTLDLLGPEPRLVGGADWEWLWTSTPPPQHAAARDVVLLGGERVDVDVDQLLAVASPRHSSHPGDPDIVAWYGIRDAAGVLVACAAHTEHVRGVPHLASIAVHPAARGTGLGAALTGEIVRRGLAAGAEVITLGMYSDNVVARRMYERLGFTCEHRWSSRRLVR